MCSSDLNSLPTDNVAPMLSWSVSGSALLAAAGTPTWLLTTNEATSANPLSSAFSYSSAPSLTFSTSVSALAGSTWSITATHSAGSSAPAGTAVMIAIAAGALQDAAGNAIALTVSVSTASVVYGAWICFQR